MIETENKKDLMLVEAALYVAGRPLGLRTLGKILGIRSKDKILEIAENLVEKYNSYNGALEVLKVKEKRFVMQVKLDYSPKVRKFHYNQC